MSCPAQASKKKPQTDPIVVGMQILVSVALLGAALYVILSKQYASDDAKWAYGIVGTIIGYWLKGK